MDRETKALELFNAGFNCAQSVFTPFAEECGIPRYQALKLATGLGAGMGRLQNTCGAVTGAILALGLYHGRSELTETQATEVTYQLVKTLVERFESLHGSSECRNILQLDLTTEDGQRVFREKNYRTTLCARCVKDAAHILNSLLEETR